MRHDVLAWNQANGYTGRSGQESSAMERKDPAITTINGVVVYLNPLPTDYKDRLVWAFFNSGAIGANRASRGEKALDQLSLELRIDRRDLKGYLRGILDTERRMAEAVLDDDLNRLNHMLHVPVESKSVPQLHPGLGYTLSDPLLDEIDQQTLIDSDLIEDNRHPDEDDAIDADR